VPDHSNPTTADHEMAVTIATTAAGVLVDLRHRLTNDGITGAALGDAGDAAAQLAIADVMAGLPATDGVLSEEAADDRSRLDAERVWIIDPLDGTREFTEPGRDDWAVHAALAIDGVAVVGAVALPALGEVWSTGNRRPLPPVPSDRPLRIVVSRTRPPAEATAVAAELGAELVPMGSAGAKAMAVVRGDAEIYLHAGGQYEWDSCAPVAVAVAAGLHASRIDGTPLRYNQPSAWMPDLLVCRTELATVVLDAVARLHSA
jgi:3'(2'), 5'-bisphosphate nucleotidase